MSLKKLYALGRLKAGVMNATEERYAQLLESLRISGAVLWYKFEGVTLKLAPCLKLQNCCVARSTRILWLWTGSSMPRCCLS